MAPQALQSFDDTQTPAEVQDVGELLSELAGEPSAATDPLLSLLPPPPRRRGRRRLVLIGVALALAGAGLAGYRYLVAGEDKPVQYRTVALERGDVVKQVTATGTLSPRVTVSVGSQVSGRLQQILVDYNSVVKKGQVLARLDARSFDAELQKARANLAAARANLKKAQAGEREAKLQYERDRDLAAQKVVAPAEVQTRLANYESARAQVAAAQASLAQSRAAVSQAQINLAYTTVVSPIDGVVVARSVDVGQTVAASLQAPTLFVIAEDLRKMEVHTNVSESDVGLLTEGMKVQFGVDAHPNDSFSGLVKQVRFEAQAVQNVVTYDAVVSVENDQLKLRPGMTANVTFIVDAREGVLRLPSAALRFRPAGAVAGKVPPMARSQSPMARSQSPMAKSQSPAVGKPAATQRGRTVWVLRDGAPVAVRVKAGLTDGTNTELVQGELREGDQLIVAALTEADGDEAGASATKPATAGGARPGGGAGGGGGGRMRGRIF